jgi:phospholipid/cholesterol/gamma-HCH transport system ATP-binding protein
MAAPPDRKPMVETVGIVNRFGAQVVHDHLDMTVVENEVFGIVGGSGTGKSVLLRTILGLQRPQEGTVKLEGRDITKLSERELRAVKARYGVTFQQGALFTALTVIQNVQLPMIEHVHLTPRMRDELAMLKIRLVGLPAESAQKYPSQLSGGMIKRAALARALIMDPPLLLLDEPTAGLDPDSSDGFVTLLRSLHRELELTVIMVTHDLDTLFELSTRIAVLADRRVIVAAAPKEVIAFQHPFIHDFFLGERGQRAMELLREYPFAV